MTRENLLENLFIYHNSLSIYYLVCVFITVLSVVLAWWYNKNNERSLNKVKFHQHTEEKCLDAQKFESEEQSGDTNNGFIGKIKNGRQSLAEQVAANMTEDQVREEKEVEKKQLEAIFQLLQTEEDKFQVSSLEELEDQLRLYRH